MVQYQSFPGSMTMPVDFDIFRRIERRGSGAGKDNWVIVRMQKAAVPSQLSVSHFVRAHGLQLSKYCTKTYSTWMQESKLLGYITLLMDKIESSKEARGAVKLIN